MTDSAWSRRSFLGGLSAAAAASHAGFAQGASTQHVLLGTQGKVSKGIYKATFDARTGELGPIALAAEIASPTFLALHVAGSRRFVYAVSEVDGDGASVSAFALTDGGTTLRLLNRQPSEGGSPTHLSLTPDGHSLAVANYNGGSVTTYHVGDDGLLSTPVSHMQYTGSGPNHDRQQAPHAHSAQFSPDGRFLLVNDLGLDRIDLYRVNAATAEITPNTPPFWTARPGSGPRHIAFHPNGRWIYSVNELDSTVDLLHWDASSGQITSVSHVSTLPADFAPNSAFAGEIVCSPDGQHVYVGNRIAADTIAVLDVDARTGALTMAQLTTNGGKTTRHIALDRTGRWMLLSNQTSGNIVVLERDRRSGRLSEPRHTYPLDSAMFALFLS